MSRPVSPGSVRTDNLAGRTIKRIFDVAVAGIGLVLTSPVLAIVAIVVRAVSRGPALFKAPRVGRHGRIYTMHKFRTMTHGRTHSGALITGPADDRVFPAGRLLRHTKIDELPQLWDVLRGEMSIVGPRPEDPRIVERHYDASMRETLAVRPGLTSPGSIFGSTHPELLGGGDPDEAYVTRMLPIKLALERVYLDRQSFSYDLRVLGRTAAVVVQLALGRTQFPEPPEMQEAERFLEVFQGLVERGLLREVQQLPEGMTQEGEGDCVWDPARQLFWAGHGPRSSRDAADHVARFFEATVVPLELVAPHFYHMDVCLMPLEGGEILYFPPAFTDEGLAELRSHVPPEQLIEVAEEDARALAINAVNVGRNVVLAAGAPRLCEQLRKRGYTPMEVDLEPFIQSGGASFCMTLRLDWERG